MIGFYARDAYVIVAKKDCIKTKEYKRKLDEAKIKYHIIECDKELTSEYDPFYSDEFIDYLHYLYVLNGHEPFEDDDSATLEAKLLPFVFYDGHYEYESDKFIERHYRRKTWIPEPTIKLTFCNDYGNIEQEIPLSICKIKFEQEI